MNTEYSGENGGTFGAGKTGVNLEQLFIAPTWSWEFTDGQGAGFGWDDMTIVKLGWQWQQSNEQTWRAGVSYGEQLIPDEEVLFNILAPGVQEWHFTVGFTHRFSEALEVSGMAFYSPRKTVRGENPMGPGQHIELSMSQVGASLSVGYQF